MPKAFFHAGQYGLVVACFHVDHTVGNQTSLGKPRGKEVGLHDAPQHLAPGARRNTGGKERRSGTVDRPVGATRYFMESPNGETAARKSFVYDWQAKGQHRPGTSLVTFKPSDPLTKFGNGARRR